MATRTRFFWLLILLVTLFVFSGCGDDDDDDDDSSPVTQDDDDDDDDDDSADDDDDDDPSQAIDEGRYWLKAGVPERARTAFATAVAIAPDNREGRYGEMLSGALHLYEFVSLVSGYLVDATEGNLPSSKDIDPNREVLRLVIETLAEGYFSPSGKSVLDNAQWLDSNVGPAFIIEDVPVFLFVEQVASLGSEFDNSEKEGCKAVGNLFSGLAGTLISIKIDFNINLILEYKLVNGSTSEIIADIIRLADQILNDPGYPDFLQIDPDYMDRIALSQTQLGLGFAGVSKTLKAVRQEYDPQQDDVIAYVDANQDGRYTAGELLRVAGVDPFDEPTTEMIDAVAFLLQDLGWAFLDRTEFDAHPNQADPFHIAALNPLLKALGLPPLIPDLIKIDVAAFYEDLEPGTIRDFLQTLVNVLQIFFPPQV